jgi:hypothetical protein
MAMVFGHADFVVLWLLLIRAEGQGRRGYPWLHLHLHLYPAPCTLHIAYCTQSVRWAAGISRADPDRPFILATQAGEQRDNEHV